MKKTNNHKNFNSNGSVLYLLSQAYKQLRYKLTSLASQLFRISSTYSVLFQGPHKENFHSFSKSLKIVHYQLSLRFR